MSNFMGRQGEGWTFLEAAGLESSIELASIGYTLSLRELYEMAPAYAEPGQFGQSA